MRNGLALVVILPILGSLVQGHSQQKSPAEVTRKTNAQKAKTEPRKVYTEDDLARLPRRGVSVVGEDPKLSSANESGGQTSAGEPSTASSAAGQSPNNPRNAEERGERYWRDRFAQARRKLDLAERELSALQREAQVTFSTPWEEPTGAVFHYPYPTSPKYVELLKKLDEKKNQIARCRQELSDLEDELRRAGGDPGWARP